MQPSVGINGTSAGYRGEKPIFLLSLCAKHGSHLLEDSELSAESHGVGSQSAAGGLGLRIGIGVLQNIWDAAVCVFF